MTAPHPHDGGHCDCDEEERHADTCDVIGGLVALAMAEERRKLRRWQLRLRWRRTMRGNSAERLRWRAWRQANGVPLESAWTFAVPIAGPKGRLP